MAKKRGERKRGLCSTSPPACFSKQPKAGPRVGGSITNVRRYVSANSRCAVWRVASHAATGCRERNAGRAPGHIIRIAWPPRSPENGTPIARPPIPRSPGSSSTAALRQLDQKHPASKHKEGRGDVRKGFWISAWYQPIGLGQRSRPASSCAKGSLEACRSSRAGAT